MWMFVSITTKVTTTPKNFLFYLGNIIKWSKYILLEYYIIFAAHIVQFLDEE